MTIQMPSLPFPIPAGPRADYPLYHNRSAADGRAGARGQHGSSTTLGTARTNGK